MLKKWTAPWSILLKVPQWFERKPVPTYRVEISNLETAKRIQCLVLVCINILDGSNIEWNLKALPQHTAIYYVLVNTLFTHLKTLKSMSC